MEVSEPDKLVGKLLFKLYRIKKKLGEGSFGKVYIACNIQTNHQYAVKLVSKNKFYNLTLCYIGKKKNGKKFVRNRSKYIKSSKSIRTS